MFKKRKSKKSKEDALETIAQENGFSVKMSDKYPTPGYLSGKNYPSNCRRAFIAGNRKSC